VAFYFAYDGSILARDLLVLIVISLSLECKTNIMTLNLLPEFASRNSGHSLYDCHSEISVRLYICLSNTPAVVNCEVSLFLQSQTWRYHSHMVAWFLSYRRSQKFIYHLSPSKECLFPWRTLTLAWLGVSNTGTRDFAWNVWSHSFPVLYQV
jgi:hypothetical protein